MSEMLENELVLYIRDRKKKPVGLLLAYGNDEGEVCIGFSLCQPRKTKVIQVNGESKRISIGDKFDRKVGQSLARNRAARWKDYNRFVVVGQRHQFRSKEEFYRNIDMKTNKHRESVKFSGLKENEELMKVPHHQTVVIDETINRYVLDFIDRCKRYFKNKNLPKWAETLLSGKI